MENDDGAVTIEEIILALRNDFGKNKCVINQDAIADRLEKYGIKDDTDYVEIVNSIAHTTVSLGITPFGQRIPMLREGKTRTQVKAQTYSPAPPPPPPHPRKRQ